MLDASTSNFDLDYNRILTKYSHKFGVFTICYSIACQSIFSLNLQLLRKYTSILPLGIQNPFTLFKKSKSGPAPKHFMFQRADLFKFSWCFSLFICSRIMGHTRCPFKIGDHQLIQLSLDPSLCNGFKILNNNHFIHMKFSTLCLQYSRLNSKNFQMLTIVIQNVNIQVNSHS